MRAALVLVVLLVPALSSADGWSAKGRCITNWPSRPACIQVSPDDVRAIQALMVAHADKRGDKKAKTFAQRAITSAPPAAALRDPEKPGLAITDSTIGPFVPMGYEFADFKGDTLEWVAVEETSQGTETGFKFIVGREKGSWRLLHYEHYRRQLPEPD